MLRCAMLSMLCALAAAMPGTALPAVIEPAEFDARLAELGQPSRILTEGFENDGSVSNLSSFTFDSGLFLFSLNETTFGAGTWFTGTNDLSLVFQPDNSFSLRFPEPVFGVRAFVESFEQGEHSVTIRGVNPAGNLNDGTVFSTTRSLGQLDNAGSILAIVSDTPFTTLTFSAQLADGRPPVEAFLVLDDIEGWTVDPTEIVPLPASAWLLLGGLAGLGALRARRGRQSRRPQRGISTQ